MSTLKKNNTHLEYQSAFEETNYVVFPKSNESFVLKIHQTNIELQQYFPHLNTWAFITAYNPLPEILSAEENAKRNKDLEKEIKALGLSYHNARGIAKDGNWSEERFFVEDCTTIEANSLAKKYGQLAFVFGEIKQPSQLIYTTFE